MGIPQGSVLGPLLWNIFYDHIMKLKLPEGVEIIGYADDTAVLVEAKNRSRKCQYFDHIYVWHHLLCTSALQFLDMRPIAVDKANTLPEFRF